MKNAGQHARRYTWDNGRQARRPIDSESRPPAFADGRATGAASAPRKKGDYKSPSERAAASRSSAFRARAALSRPMFTRRSASSIC